MDFFFGYYVNEGAKGNEGLSNRALVQDQGYVNDFVNWSSRRFYLSLNGNFSMKEAA